MLQFARVHVVLTHVAPALLNYAASGSGALTTSGTYPAHATGTGTGHRSRTVAAALAAILTVALAAGTAFGESQRISTEAETAAARQQYDSALAAAAQRLAGATSTVQSLAAATESARRLHTASAGRLANDGARVWLAAAITSADELRSLLATAITDAGAAMAEAPEEDSTAQILTEATSTLDSLAVVDVRNVEVVRGALAHSVEDVTVAVATWQAEQDRLAAEAAAQAAALAASMAAAALAAADRASAQSAIESRDTVDDASGATGSTIPAAGATTPPASAAPYAEYVWATGFQNELDACKGSVNMAPYFGTAVIGEHWSCGGRSFPKTSGSLVVLSGVLSGTYEVGGVVAVLSQKTNTTADVPRTYDLLYQTCLNGDNTQMSFTQLTRVG